MLLSGFTRLHVEDYDRQILTSPRCLPTNPATSARFVAQPIVPDTVTLTSTVAKPSSRMQAAQTIHSVPTQRIAILIQQLKNTEGWLQHTLKTLESKEITDPNLAAHTGNLVFALGFADVQKTIVSLESLEFHPCHFSIVALARIWINSSGYEHVRSNVSSLKSAKRIQQVEAIY